MLSGSQSGVIIIALISLVGLEFIRQFGELFINAWMGLSGLLLVTFLCFVLARNKERGVW